MTCPTRQGQMNLNILKGIKTISYTIDNITLFISVSGLYYKNILMIVSEAWTINVLLALALLSIN
jgi:hypothetical protein